MKTDLISHIGRRTLNLTDGATFAVALFTYISTAAPGLLPADAGEFQWIAARMGVAHPPGYPLYVLVGHLFIRLLPIGSPAYRLNLMSALLAAATLVLISRAARSWARQLGADPLPSLGAGLAAALTLGTATTFWAQATIANVRTPAVFFAALALYSLARFAAAADRRQADRALITLALALGLGGSHYPPLAFVAVFFVVYLLLTDPHLLVQPRRWLRPALVGLAGFIVPLVYIPLRGLASAPQSSPDMATWPGFLHHFLARGFSGDMFAFANSTDLPNRLALVPTLFSFQFNIFLLLTALLVLAVLARRAGPLFVLLAGGLTLHTFVSVTYRAPQTVEYLMPAYLFIAIAAGMLPALVKSRLRSIILCVIVLYVAFLNGRLHAPSFVELANDDSTRQTVEPLIESAPSNALILADWRWATPLWYLQQVEHLRPDVQVSYVYNVPGEEYPDTWRRRIQEADPARPLLLTHFYEFPGYTTEPWKAGFLIRPRPVTAPAAPLAPLDVTFGDRVQVIGYSLRPESLHPGQLAEFTLAWRVTGSLDPPPSLTLALLDTTGRRVSQADRALPTDLAPGEVRFERLVMPLYPTLPPGRYRVTLGAYTVTDAGFETIPAADGDDAAPLTDLELVPLSRPPFTLHPQKASFADGPTLVGVDYDHSLPDVLRVYLHWRGPAGAGTQAQVQSESGAQATVTLPSIPEGTYQTVALTLAAEGRLSLTLSSSGSERSVRLPTPLPDARFVPLGDQMAVVGVAANPAPPGGTMTIDVALAALRPLTDDDGISVRLLAPDGRWLDRHDIQPALGAIPTLKWIRGSLVADRHLLHVPGDFDGDQVQATLVAYERFRMTTLAPLDGRFSQVPLGTWSLP